MPSLKDSFDLVLENADTLKEQSAAAQARAQVEAEAATSPDLKGKATVGGAVQSVVEPAARGVALGAANTLRTGEWLARSAGLMDKNQPSVGEYMANKIEADAEGKNNLPQNLIQGAAQFFTGLKGVRAGSAALGLAGKGTALMSRGGQLAKDALSGVAGANVGFDPYQERLVPAAVRGLAGLAEADPKIMSQLRSYLLTSKDDPEGLARLKGMLGDALTGAVASPAFRGGAALAGKWSKALGSWLGDVAQQERQVQPTPTPSGPTAPHLQSSARDYQRLRSGRDIPTTPFDPYSLQVAEERALQGPLDYNSLKAEVWDQFRHLSDQGEPFEWAPSSRPTHPEMSELAPNGQTYAMVLDALHQKYGYESNGHVDPQQAWAQHGWLFSPDALGAYTAEIRAGQMAKPIAGGSTTVEEAAGPLAHDQRPVPMAPSQARQPAQQGSGIADILSGLGEKLTGMKPAEIEAEINRVMGIGEKPALTGTRIFEDTTFNGKRMSTLFQTPNDNMVVIQKDGKDAGYLWYERQPEGGFKTHKIEVLPEFQRQGLATQLMDKVESIEGTNHGPTTERTPQGQAFNEGRTKKRSLEMTIQYDPKVEGILGVPEAGRGAVQQAIAERARERGVKPYDLQEVLKAIDALKEKK